MFFFFSSRRRHTRLQGDWSSDVCSSDLVVLEAVPEKGFIGFELGADGAGGANLWLPGSGSRHFEDPERYVKMNGREVFKFATRVLVQSAEDLLDRCGMTIEDVDLYIPHQANVRIIDHATRKLGV